MIDKVKNWGIYYYESDTIVIQGSYNKVKKYLNNGYFIKEDRNGYWVLYKPTNVILSITDFNDKEYYLYLKQYILEYYNKERISKKLFEKFKKEMIENKELLIKIINDLSCYLIRRD